jgi:type II secretory pathway pseudopilin PulG
MFTSHQKKYRSAQGGVSIVEAIVVISIISVSFAAILSAILFFLRGGLLATDQAQALFLLEESVEAVRFLRDEGYLINITPLVGTGTYYLEPTSSGWTTSTTNTPVLGKFTRSIIVSEVYRRVSDDDIVPSTSPDSKAVDPGTVKLDVIITWSGGAVQSSTYVTDLYEN